MTGDYSAPIRMVYSQCVDRLIANIARHFPHAALDQGGSFDWETAKLAELGQLRRENLRIIAEMVGDTSGMTEIALEKAMTDALKRGAPDLLAAVKAGMLEAVAPVGMSASMHGVLRYYSLQAAVQTNLVNTVMLTDSLNAYRRVVARVGATQAALRNVAQGVLNTATGEVVTGISSLQAAVRDAVRQMAQEGIVGYVDKAGHNWSPDAYVEMDIRSTAGNVAREAVFQQNKEYGVDLVIVPVHAIARPGCAPYQGWVISMSNQGGYTTDASGHRVPVHPVRATSFGEPAGLWGINCSHQPDPFIPGWSESARPVEAGEVNARYEQTQKQRYHEQQVKKWKRSAVAADASGDTEAFKAAAAKVKEQQSALKAYCEKTGLPFSSDRTQVFGYNKSVSGKAVAAVRKPATVTAGGSPVVLVKKTDIHGVPNSITQETVKKGGINRNFYGADGKQERQISNHDHGNVVESKFGLHGEHGHDYVWDGETLVGRPS
ncbi:MAG: phage minor capsid protein, partial [Candidatus Limiplasma sp.]|nr:phage minor capsid protein [Candidatus Limiplasma sp.]